MKFYGKVAFWIDDVEVEPGIFKPKIVERSYFGDVRKNERRWNEADQINDQFKVNNTISIVSDLYLRNNYTSIKYIIWNNIKLKVLSVTFEEYPRVKLEIGGMYNGENAPNSA